MGKQFKILAIDGGGMKGLYSASVLKVLENHFGVSLSQTFDLICGTSTGAIITAAIASGHSASNMQDFYKIRGPRIFKKVSGGYAFCRQLFWRAKYRNDTLKKELKELLGDKRFKDSANNICILAHNLSTGKPYVFKTDHNESLSRDSNVFLWEAALASASAPTYFPVYASSSAELKGNKFVDGGVWGNNPSLVALVEALKYFVGEGKEHDSFILISVPNIYESFSKIKVHPFQNSILGWNKGLIELFFSAQTESIQYSVKHLCDCVAGEYYRIPVPPIPKDLIVKTKLDSINSDVLDHMSVSGEKTGNDIKNIEIIKRVFLNKNKREV